MQFGYDWLQMPEGGGVRFSCDLFKTIPDAFEGVLLGALVAHLREAKVLRKNQGSLVGVDLVVWFSNQQAGQNFIDRLNKYIGEQVEDQKSTGPVVTQRERLQAGSCNFCTSQHRMVWVISGDHIQIRLCNDCFVKVRQQINQLGGG